MRDGWEMLNPDLNRWLACGPRAAAYWACDGVPVRLVSAADRAVNHAYVELSVPPWVVKNGVRGAGGSEARALACLCLEADGYTQRQIAEAMGLACSSVCEAMATYRHRHTIARALAMWPRSETSRLANQPHEVTA